MMWKQLLYKWFGLVDIHVCQTCEVLREQLASSERERRELLTRLLDKDKPEPSTLPEERELKPIGVQHVPWRIRQQMLEAEDRKQAQLLKQKTQEITELEKELGVK